MNAQKQRVVHHVVLNEEVGVKPKLPGNRKKKGGKRGGGCESRRKGTQCGGLRAQHTTDVAYLFHKGRLERAEVDVGGQVAVLEHRGARRNLLRLDQTLVSRS